MITLDKQANALWAINAVLVLGRQLAHEGKSAEVSEVLDTAEYLPILMLDAKDQTEVFRGHLADLASKRPAFALALERFESPNLPESYRG